MGHIDHVRRAAAPGDLPCLLGAGGQTEGHRRPSDRSHAPGGNRDSSGLGRGGEPGRLDQPRALGGATMIPIIGDVLDLVEKGLDKLFPDKNVKIQTETDLQKFREKLKSDLKMFIVQEAATEKKLLFQDTEGARQVYIEELRAKRVPSWARGVQAMGRQFALYGTVALYLYSKVSIQLGLPEIALNERDYWLIGTVFVFLFGARSVEKILGKA